MNKIKQNWNHSFTIWDDYCLTLTSAYTPSTIYSFFSTWQVEVINDDVMDSVGKHF